ncbi:hypothetical protein IW262DRAFT_1301679 [Armillaria fumosa]|nr:hypothetical protein IW262DRAFT_1301679 [Armillaria fumosa]
MYLSRPYLWATYARWTATYGDVLYLDTPRSPSVVINSAKAAVDLFDNRARNYSDKPVHAYYPVQMRSTLVMLQQLLKSPDAFVRHIRHTYNLRGYTGSVIIKVVYEYDVDINGDKFVELVDRALFRIHSWYFCKSQFGPFEIQSDFHTFMRRDVLA